MKILFLLTQDIESPSGLGRYFPFAKALTDLGHEAVYAGLHPSYKSLKKKQFTVNQVQVKYVAPMHVRKTGNQKTYYNFFQLLLILLFSTLRLTWTAITTRADVIVIGKPQPMNTIAGYLGKLFHHSYLIVDCDDYETGSGNFKSGFQKAMVNFFEKTAPRFADAVTTNTFFMRDHLVAWGVKPDCIYYLPNGFDEKRFSQPISEDQIDRLRAEIGLDGKKVIAFIGSLSLVNHPVDLLIDAMVMIQKKIPESLLLFVGGGEDFDVLKQKIQQMGLSGSVYLSGRIPSDRIPLYYRLAQVTVDPVYDNDAARGRCPLKLFESWVCQVPFVTSDVGDRQRLMAGRQAALLARPGDPLSLAEAIVQILTQPGLSAQLAAQGNELSEQYRWHILAEDWLAYFHQKALRN